MKFLSLLVLVFAGYYLDGYRLFSEDHVRQYLVDMNMNTFQGNTETVCGLFVDDAEVSINDRSPQGRWEVEGGKEEVCGYIKQSAAGFMTMGVHVNTAWDDVVIHRAGFPWRTAEVTYRQTTQITANGRVPIPPMTAVSDDTVVLKRTLGGLKIAKFQADSETTVGE